MSVQDENVKCAAEIPNSFCLLLIKSSLLNLLRNTFVTHAIAMMAMGDSDEMRKAIQLLDEVKESIINAYQIKTGLSRTKLSHLMDGETWMNALKAKELGFCDEVLYTGDIDLPDNVSGFSFGRREAAACLMNRVIATLPKPVLAVPAEPAHPPDPDPIPEPVPDNRVKAADLEKRLSLLK